MMEAQRTTLLKCIFQNCCNFVRSVITGKLYLLFEILKDCFFDTHDRWMALALNLLKLLFC